MYWLRWHYHVKDIAGAPYKIKKKERKKRKEKQNNRIADSRRSVVDEGGNLSVSEHSLNTVNCITYRSGIQKQMLTEVKVNGLEKVDNYEVKAHT